MSRKQRIVDEARRILGSYEIAADAVESAVASMTRAAHPATDSFEGFSMPLPGAAGAGSAVAELTPVDRAVALQSQQELKDGLTAMKKVEIGRDDDISDQDQNGLEAIILLAGRPAILIQEGDFMEPPKLWAGPEGRPRPDQRGHPARRPNRGRRTIRTSSGSAPAGSRETTSSSPIATSRSSSRAGNGRHVDVPRPDGRRA